MSDANRTLLSLVKESVFNTTPATPAFRPLRMKSSSLAFTPKTDTTKEIRADRQIPDLIRLGFEAAGQVPMETSFGALDDIIEGAQMNTWTLRGAQVENTAAGTPITAVSATTFSCGTATFAVGDLVRASGFINPANNGIFEAAAGTVSGSLVTAGGLVVETPPKGAKLTFCGKKFAATALSADVSGTLTRASGSWITDGFVAGEWIKIGSGSIPGNAFATAGCNGWARISVVTALVLTFDVVPTGYATDAGTGKTVSIFMGDYIRNGTTPQSYTLEQQFQDLVTPEFHLYTGMRVGNLTLTAASQSIMESNVTFMGANATFATTRFAGATDLPIATGEVLNTSSNVGRIAENGVALAVPNYVMNSEITIDNTLRRQNAIGTPGSIGIGLGRANVSGKLSTYYGDMTLLNRLLNNTATSFDQRVSSSDGSYATIFDVPLAKYATGAPTVPGVDTDRMLELTFQGLLHPTLGYTLHIQRFAGVQ